MRETTEADLLRAIRASPDDLALREVYADWLLERGDLRGEFIMRQLRFEPHDELLAEHGEAWFGALARLPRYGWILDWRGGFVTRLRYYQDERRRLATPAGQARALGDALEQPAGALVGTVTLATDSDVSTVRAIVGALAAAPRPQLHSLELTVRTQPARFSADEFQALLAALPGLDTLSLQGVELTRGCLRHPTLRELVFGVLDSEITFDGCALSGLETLVISAHRLERSTLTRATFPRLRELHLPTAFRSTFAALAKQEVAAQLETIHVHSLYDLDADEVRRLLPALRWISVRD